MLHRHLSDDDNRRAFSPSRQRELRDALECAQDRWSLPLPALAWLAGHWAAYKRLCHAQHALEHFSRQVRDYDLSPCGDMEAGPCLLEGWETGCHDRKQADVRRAKIESGDFLDGLDFAISS